MELWELPSFPNPTPQSTVELSIQQKEYAYLLSEGEYGTKTHHLSGSHGSHLKTHQIITWHVAILDLLPGPKYTEIEGMN